MQRTDFWSLLGVAAALIVIYLLQACTTYEPPTQQAVGFPECINSGVGWQEMTVDAIPTVDPSLALQADWSLDGSTITYISQGAVWSATYPSFLPKQLLTIDNYLLRQVIWSPDGSRFAVYGQTGTDIFADGFWTATPSGTLSPNLLQDVAILQPFRDKRILAWLNDVQVGLTIHGGTGIDHLWVIHTEEQTVLPLIDLLVDDSVAGGVIGGAYFISPTNPDVIVVDHGGGHLAIVDLANNTAMRLSELDSPPSEFFQDWEPNGITFLYTFFRQDKQVWELRRWNLADQSSELVLAKVKLARYAPDGQTVAFVREVQEQVQLGILSLKDHREYVVSVMSAESGQPSKDRYSHLSWSPDGKHLLYARPGQAAQVSDVKAKCTVSLKTIEAPIYQHEWAADSAKILFLQADKLQVAVRSE